MKDLETLARYHFGLELPTSSISLKKAYRQQCLKLHPDIGGDAEQFKEMQAAYNLLTNSGSIVNVISGEETFKSEVILNTTVDGIPLTHLGLGLGPTTNGRDCPECHHNGYLTQEEYEYGACPKCGGLGISSSVETCRACKGTGKFQQAHSKRIVECRVCRGTGTFHYRQQNRQPRNLFDLLFGNVPNCIRCGGSGKIKIKESKILKYYRCHRCNGTGEIPIWNPVIPKASLGGQHGKRHK